VSSVLIVAKTRMQQGRICVGAHDLADFRSLRLFRHEGSRIAEDAGLDVGDVWEMDYIDRANPTAPHLEDVLVQQGARRTGREPNPAALILERDTVWRTPDDLFDGCLSFTANGTAYVPEEGPLPTRSTGYWQPEHELTLYYSYEKSRYRWTGEGGLNGIRYVGVSEPAQTIPPGSLVRLSLSHPIAPGTNPMGFWLQLSGWFPL
jgi:hypothetical protein